MYTSAGDLSSLGRAILRSTLIKPAMTRRWLKPVSFSSDPNAGVGMPWGIRRIELEKSRHPQNPDCSFQVSLTPETRPNIPIRPHLQQNRQPRRLQLPLRHPPRTRHRHHSPRSRRPTRRNLKRHCRSPHPNLHPHSLQHCPVPSQNHLRRALPPRQPPT